MLLNMDMEEFKIRLENLRKLIAVAKSVGATQKAVSERLGVEPSRFSQLCGPNPIRQIHEPTAREFEKNLNRPKRWLDSNRTDDELLSAWLKKGLANNQIESHSSQTASSDDPYSHITTVKPPKSREPRTFNIYKSEPVSKRLEKIIADAQFLDFHNAISEQNFALLESVIALIKDSNKEKLQASLSHKTEANADAPNPEDSTGTQNSVVKKVLSIDPTSLLSTKEATSKQKL